MIKLERSRIASAFPGDFTGARLTTKHEDLIDRYYTGMESKTAVVFSSAKWKSAKPKLRKDSADKCAYCEASTAIVAHGDVDHFRPKSLYWWLAYNFDNFVYACQICNQSFKGDRFPVGKPRLKGPSMPAVRPKALALTKLAKKLAVDPSASKETQVRTHWSRESPQLLHPYLDDPEKYFAYRVDDANENVWIVPSKTKDAKTFVKACVEVFGLNREELLKLRYQHYKSLAVLHELHQMGVSKTVQKKIKGEFSRNMKSNVPFAGMSRFFIRSAWKLKGV
ncbi:hypothetical protein QRQ56_15290 [Bradyrhizobium sp. U531]|uniref:hypothetical protein n=1 Tax=Bradyrhizobium sp. U531 TaxID=3053458 RepID=UPI003F41D8D6